MTITTQKTRKIGGSLMVRIPKEIIQVEGIKAGENVQIDVRKIKKDWFGAFPQLKPFTKHDRLRSHYE